MQRFLISVFGTTLISWIILLIFATKTKAGEAGVFQDLILTILLFLTASFTISLILYFGRLLISKIASRGKLKFEEGTFIDLRPVWRRSFKMSTVISAFISVLAFLQLQELLNLFNLALLLTIVILGTIWLRR